MRSPKLDMHKLPLFVWAVFITAFLLLLSLPVLAGATYYNLVKNKYVRLEWTIAPALNLAIFWKLLGNTGQSAGNLLSLPFLGILRDYTPSLVCYKSKENITLKKKIVHPKTNMFILGRLVSLRANISVFNELFSHKEINTKSTYKIKYLASTDASILDSSNDNFIMYLTGLIEGDGTIVVPKSERSPKGVLNYPSIQICFHLKDLPLALLIQKNLGYGSLTRKKGVNAYVLTINNKEGLLSLISLINGNMRTPKIYALWRLIDWLNKKNVNIIKKPLNTSSLKDNAWLSGFIEADGHFSIRTTQNNKYTKIECKFELCQSQSDINGNSNLYFLEDIAEFLFTVVKPIRINKANSEFRVRTTNLKGNLSLELYLNNYPLFGTKFLDFKSWIKVLNLFRAGKFNHQFNIEKVIPIKLNMNDKRTILVWDHLQYFYNLNK